MGDGTIEMTMIYVLDESSMQYKVGKVFGPYRRK